MIESVALKDTPRVPAAVILSENETCGDHNERGYSRGQEVGRVVRLRRELSEKFVPVVAIADHRIHRIDRLIDHAEDRAAQTRIEHGRDNTVARVFGGRLDGGARYPVGVERVDVTADDHGDGAPGVVKGSVSKRRADLHAFVAQRFRREYIACENRLDERAEPQVDRVRADGQRRGNKRCREYDERPEKSAARELRARIPNAQVDRAREPLFERPDQRPDHADRMRKPARIPDEQIEEQARLKRGDMI